jgi:hypothetical protein
MKTRLVLATMVAAVGLYGLTMAVRLLATLNTMVSGG